MEFQSSCKCFSIEKTRMFLHRLQWTFKLQNISPKCKSPLSFLSRLFLKFFRLHFYLIFVSCAMSTSESQVRIYKCHRYNSMEVKFLRQNPSISNAKLVYLHFYQKNKKPRKYHSCSAMLLIQLNIFSFIPAIFIRRLQRNATHPSWTRQASTSAQLDTLVLRAWQVTIMGRQSELCVDIQHSRRLLELVHAHQTAEWGENWQRLFDVQGAH